MIRTAKMSRWFAGTAAIVAVGLMAGFTSVKDDHKVEVNEKAPNFTLKDLSGNEHSLKDFTEKGHTVVLEWYNPECPFVKKHYRDDSRTMLKLQEQFKNEKITWLRINSGAEGKQGAGAEHNRTMAGEFGITTPILLDETGKVGKMYGAKRTPEMYVIDAEGVLRYWGAIDDDSGFRTIGKTNYVESAIKSVLAGETVKVQKTKAYGCSVKY
jgi:peroxiredoxin